MVIIRPPKSLSKFESLIAHFTKAPNELRRPLDDMNSLLCELMDGSRTLEQITQLMDLTFHERITPVDERVEASVTNLMALGLAVVRNSPINGEWDISPLHDPSESLSEIDPSLGIIEEE